MRAGLVWMACSRDSICPSLQRFSVLPSSHPIPISTSTGATYSSIANAVSAALITRSASFGRFFVSMIERQRNGRRPQAYQGVGQSVNAVAAAPGEAGFHAAVAREARKRRAISSAICPLELIGS